MLDSKTLQIPTARVFVPLLAPARYKGAHGGRGSGKSHFFGEMGVEALYRSPVRMVCIREVQHSLRESSRQLMLDKIQKFDLGSFFEITEAEIRGANGSLCIFRGMQSYNAETIKSLEGFDLVWVEEAQTMSATSLKMLRPTLRKEGSELWFSWNPRHDTDPVDEFFRSGTPYPGSVCVQANYMDNPWFPDVLREEKEHDYADDPENADHVWGGGYEIISEGSYLARDLAMVEKDGRVGFFPHDPDLPVSTGWDLGVDDYTAIWFFQENGKQVRAIDYAEFSGVGAEQIIEGALPELLDDKRKSKLQLEVIGREKPYRYAAHYLPHDVLVREWGHGAKTRYQSLKELGVKQETMRVGVAANPQDRINASRRLLKFMSFHRNEGKTEGVNLGVKRLRNYKRRMNQTTQQYVGPLKDGNDHGADAFGEYAINCYLSAPEPPEKVRKVFDAYGAAKDRDDMKMTSPNDGLFS